MSLSLSSGLGAILNIFFQMYIPRYTADEVVWLLTFPALFIGLGKYQQSEDFV